jgi:hypothetical protein
MGLLDAAHLGKALQQVLLEGRNPEVLANYAETRRRIFLERTEPITHANFMRLCSEEPAHVAERTETFARLNDPKDFPSALRIGLPDFGLTSTSDKIFDTTSEVTWFISVTKISEWPEDRFQHEYKTVHANMTRGMAKQVPVIRRYVQLQNLRRTIPGAACPTWDYVTCLTWPSLFVLHAGFSDPGYRATAGAHIFCQLNQEGCIVSQVANFSKTAQVDDKADIGAIQALIYHKRTDASDEYPLSWFTERAVKWKDLSASDDRVGTYILWKDITPKNVDYFFHDTQFSGGSWLKYKAIETLIFASQGAADSFFDQHARNLLGEAAAVSETEVVVGLPDLIV